MSTLFLIRLISVCCQDDSNSSVLAGQCDCKVNTMGRQCSMCKDGFYNLSRSHPTGCIPCGCILDGTRNRRSSCHTTTGQCDCKDRVTGINKISSQFSRLYELLDSNVKRFCNIVYNVTCKVTQIQPSKSACSIILWMHAGDAMKPLKCMSVTFQLFWRNQDLIK